MSADGHRLYHRPATWWAVPMKRIPKHVRAALIFQEDQRFAQHAGVDPRAFVRAMAKTLMGKRQGASTIPMQVAKHCLLDYGTLPARRGLHGIIRKGRNMLLAWRLVHVEGREKILEYYLNHATMGPGELRGIGPAAWSYFRKKPHELSLEATQLAVLLRSPSRSVRAHPHRARYEAQRKTLLRRMYEAGAIDRSAYHTALRSPKIYPPDKYPIGITMPQSVATAFRAIDPMLRQFDLGGTPQALRYRQPFPLHVRVSLHAALSWRFDEAMAPALADPELKYAVVILVDGRPVVLFDGHLDLYHYVFQARRQVGSVSKLFFYDAVWQLGYIQPHTIVADGDMSESLRQRLSRPRYHPHNDDGRWRAPLAHHESLSQSVNKIAYRTTWGERTQAQRLTIARTLVHRFAFPWYHVTDRSIHHFVHTFTADESVALDTWQASPFDVAGMLEQGFRGVSLSHDHLILSWNGEPVSQPNATAERRISQHLLSALQDAVAATAPQAVLHDPHWALAAKTGTTDGGCDAWLVGFLLTVPQTRQVPIHPRITFVVWAGYDDNRPAGLYGGAIHGPVFSRFLQDAHVKTVFRSLLQK